MKNQPAVTHPVLAKDGRTIIGSARSELQAKRLLMKTLDVSTVSSIKKHGFTLNVWLRDDFAVELNGGLMGYMYAVGK